MANRIVCGIGWTTASSIVKNLVHLLQLAILTRFLDRADFGIVAIAHLFVGFTAIFLNMGISVGIIHRQNITNNEYSSLFWLNIISGIILTMGLYFIAPLLTVGYHSQDLTNVVQLICFTIFISALGAQQRTYCQKKTFFSRLAIIEIIGAIVTIIVAVVTAMIGYGVYSLAYSAIIGSIVINLTHLVIGIVKDCRLHFHFLISETLPFLKIGIYQVGSSILDFFSRELDVLIISSTIGLDFLGVYNIAKRIPVSLYSFIQPIIIRVFSPIMAEKQGDLTVLKTNYIVLSKALSWISFPMYFLLAAISPTVIYVVFGQSYLDGVPVMMVFCLLYAFNGVNGVCSALQTATGRTDIGLIWTIYLITSTAIVYYLTSSFGITLFLFGICTLTVFSVFMVWYIQFRIMVKIRLSEYLSIYSRSFLICIILFAIFFYINPTPSIIYSVCAGIIYLMVYAFFMMKTADGKEILKVTKFLLA